MDKDYLNLPAEKFTLVAGRDFSYDNLPQTKPVGYFNGAFRRFCKNKGSVVAAVIIAFLILYALIAPLCTPFYVNYADGTYAFSLPRCGLFENVGFWDGCEQKELNEQSFIYYDAMGRETGHFAVKDGKAERSADGRRFKFRLDSVHSVGCVYRRVTQEEYLQIQEYQNKTGVQVVYPIIAPQDRPQSSADATDANYYYKTTAAAGGKTQAVLDESGNVIPVYKFRLAGEPVQDGYNSLRIAEPQGIEYEYAVANDLAWEIRVNYYEYFIFNHTCRIKDGVTKPNFLFGTNGEGQDIFACLAYGARFSFLFAIGVAVVNMLIGALYGAAEGYYGGMTDLVLERLSDILNAVPFMIVITLLKLHLGGASNVLVLFIAFFLTGWISMAQSTRMQFYRFKNQEYVLAARTLGASDARLMFKHIFPNAIGTLVTGFALVIPGMIYSETSLSYLGIINLSSGNLTSVGTLLAAGQASLTTFPHVIFFPSLFLALLMLSFNLFGNGLRDAFNPSLIGAEK